jgi:hypothetical protein
LSSSWRLLRRSDIVLAPFIKWTLSFLRPPDRVAIILLMLLAAVIEVPLIEVIEVLLLIPTCAFPNNPAVAQELLCRELDDVNRRGIVKYKRCDLYRRNPGSFAQ